ncbi:hypothetical protein [Flavobacterium sp.]|jgi:hypothetical protein|uniref:hypothetical protein n=1 Tax=Flavobacterium sp. TaxID=239 RepID=UPI0037C08B59
MEQFYKLLKLALADGELSIKERELLLMKASQLGIDAIEAEMIIEGEISMLNKSIPETYEESDGFLISNEELLLRVTKWVNRVSEKSIKVEIEPFPRLKEDTKSYHKYTDQGTAILNKINSSKIVNITGMMPGVGSIIKVGLTLGGVNKVQKIENKDIIEITDKYLLILELRSLKNEVMLMKYNELNDLYKSKLIENNTKKGFFNLF